MTSFFLPALLRSTTGKTAVFWVLSGLWGFITILPHALLTAQPTAVPVLPAPPPARGDARNPNPMPDTRVLAVVFLEWLQGPSLLAGKDGMETDFEPDMAELLVWSSCFASAHLSGSAIKLAAGLHTGIGLTTLNT